jgi:hypothetical protein
MVGRGGVEGRGVFRVLVEKTERVSRTTWETQA